MVQFTDALFLALVTATVRAMPLSLTKRIAQTTIDAVTPWESACTAAGGAQQCNPIAVTAASTLLAAAGPCDQQNSGDAMINLAKTLNNDADMISLAQIFVQQPRNSPNSQAVPYCQTAPQNSELNGLFQCQFQGSDQTTFVGGIKVGGAGTIPFGQNAPLNPAGSCPANPSGPVPDGQQLNAITKNPGVASSGSSSSASSGSASAGNSSTPATSNNNGAGSGSAAGTGDGAAAGTGSATATGAGSAAGTGAASAAGTAASSTADSGSSSSSGFALSNGQEAQKLNAQFATLSASSSCQDGENACVGGAFAQCVGGSFVTTACAGGTTCAALPLVNKAGTSITCTTTADAEARIAATGATGGLTGSGAASSGDDSSAATATAATSNPPATTAAASTPATNNAAASTSSFALSNGQEAQKLNSQFATLSTSSSCTAGQNACVNGGFAQCVNGSFQVTQCGSGLTCAALPLVNSAGTSITCTTTADAESRIAATGATGGLTGSN